MSNYGISLVHWFLLVNGILVAPLLLLVSNSVHAEPSRDPPGFSNNFYLTHTSQKLVDNRGRGYEPLYGTRNLRYVLRGVVYRGGANNAVHRSRPRDNRNPLPLDALRNLCSEGFKTAVYLYPTNYHIAPREILCNLRRGGQGRLIYTHLSPKNKDDMRKILEIVQAAALETPSSGPIYLHCWNGWHASGLAAAIILRQFCGLGPEAAVRYWDKNTDSHNQDKSHETFRKQISGFVPYKDLRLPEERILKLCPKPEELFDVPLKRENLPRQSSPSRTMKSSREG